MTVHLELSRSSDAPLALTREKVHLPADPAEVLGRLRGQRHLVALFGSWNHGSSVIGWDPLLELSAESDPFDALDGSLGALSGGFGGGWIGALGYGLGEQLEDVRAESPGLRFAPLHRLAFYDRVLVRRQDGWWYERLTGLLGAKEQSDRDLDLHATLDLIRQRGTAAAPFEVGDFAPVPSNAAHLEGIRTVQAAIEAGELFQANLTQRLEATFSGDPLDVFIRGWRKMRPAYAAYLGWPDAEIASFSPELFLRRSGERVLTSPIKGTAPSEADPRELEKSVKDRAENVMIVDLMRNDLARVCEPGSVTVPSLNRVEEHAVRHLVSDVQGRVSQRTGNGLLLRSIFPPGSVTGAPKVAAQQLLNRLEPTPREAYTGAFGYVSPAAGLEMSVVIRTLEFAPGRVWLGVGGGVTTLSDPVTELEECAVKARPILNAIGALLVSEDADSPTEVAPPRSNQPNRTVGRPPPQLQRPAWPTPAVTRIRHELDHHKPWSKVRVLVLDNYDSFVFNLVDYLRTAGCAAAVVRNDAVTVEELAGLRREGVFTHVLLSPGPASPVEAGICVDLVRRLGPITPTLGVCLGHQIIAEAFGAKVTRASTPVHGRTESIVHDQRGLLRGLPSPLTVARYHSLIVTPTSLPIWLGPTSWSSDRELMGIRHQRHTHIEGVQWHPESILTEHGRSVIANFARTMVQPRRTHRNRGETA